jgi:uncharacterized protein (TIGR02145 family)
MNSTLIKAISILLITLMFGCSSEKEAAKTVPQLTTTTATNITLTSASTGGNVSADGGDPITSKGVVWNTATAPTINLATKTADGTGIASFTSAISNLNPSTNYYARAYASNSVGTGYGNEITFTTGAIVLPTLTTTAVTNITTNSAKTGGIITDDGGRSITTRGIVWSTSPNPTINLTTKTIDGSGTGNYTTNLVNLSSNTLYYVRAYAINNAGTGYGNEISFTTPLPFPIISINTQTWSKTNLDVTTYNDGTTIPQVTDPTQWANLNTGAWCYYNNDPTNGDIYGKLYNWFAVAGIHDAASLNNPSLRKKLAPNGWHIPSRSEWGILGEYLGGVYSGAGGKMKETGTVHWSDPNFNASNSSGFNGLPGGARDADHGGPGMRFVVIKYVGYWWTSSEHTNNASLSWIKILEYNSDSLFQGYPSQKNGYSVRCVKD